MGFGTQGFGIMVESFAGEVTHLVGVGAYTTLVALLLTAQSPPHYWLESDGP